MARLRYQTASAALCAVLALAGCEEGAQFNLFPPKDDSVASGSTSTRLIERDVEAPDVFNAKEAGLWDGRPSLGGVWVAYPDVAAPERVIIRNESNGKFVIGALFSRERENPGPRIQVSSDAASALGLLAGQPTALSVTALRKEEVPEEPQVEPAPEGEIEASALDPIAAAAAAIDAAESTGTSAPVGDISPAASTPPAPKPAAVPAAKPAATGLKKPFIQIGIFSVEANATGTADLMRGNGIVPKVLAQKSSGKAFWRVIVGPAGSESERAALLKKIKGLGFDDAYFVSN